MNMDLDLDGHDVPSQEPTRKFAPKNSKFKPKPKLKAEPLASEPPPTLAQELGSAPSIGKEELDTKPPPLVDSITTTTKTEYEPSHISSVENSTVKMDIEETLETEQPKEDLMEEDKNEDQVVREIDVYFSPPVDPNTQLYVLQYPLRPCWRPYEIDERCEEVRVKSKSSEVEMDLSIDVDSKNYDADASDRVKMTKQVLSTVWKPRRTTGYVVGVLVDNKLHLNPIHSVVQLRPSMQHLKPGSSKKKNSTVSQVEANKPGPSNEQNKDSEEPWIPLKYHDSKSDISTTYRRKMVALTDSQIPFSMTSYEYLSSLCPPTSNHDVRSKGPSRRILLSLPLEDRFKTWLLEGPPIHRFNALKHLAPNDSDEDVLQVLKNLAHVIQGLWIPRSALLYPGDQNSAKLARDYILLLFSKNPIISSTQLPQRPELAKHMKEVLNVLAIERPTLSDWKFKEPRDVSFIKLHPDIVKQQEQVWEQNGKKITDLIYRQESRTATRNPSKPNTVDRPVASKNSNKVAPKTSNGAPSRASMPDETREALPKALQKLFQAHKVCSFEQICQRLRDTAVSESARPKGVPRELIAAAKGVDFRDELLEIINQLAIDIHGVFVSKSSPDHPQYDDLRSIVIGLLKAERNAKLKKAAVIEAAKMQLNREITNPEFQKVISELCTSQGSAWVLKSGDGNPK